MGKQHVILQRLGDGGEESQARGAQAEGGGDAGGGSTAGRGAAVQALGARARRERTCMDHGGRALITRASCRCSRGRPVRTGVLALCSAGAHSLLSGDSGVNRGMFRKGHGGSGARMGL